MDTTITLTPDQKSLVIFALSAYTDFYQRQVIQQTTQKGVPLMDTVHNRPLAATKMGEYEDLIDTFKRVKAIIVVK